MEVFNYSRLCVTEKRKYYAADKFVTQNCHELFYLPISALLQWDYFHYDNVDDGQQW